MTRGNRASLADYVTELQSKGRIVFDADEAVVALGTNRGAFLDAAQRLQKRGSLISPRKGFYVAVPRNLRPGARRRRPGMWTHS